MSGDNQRVALFGGDYEHTIGLSQTRAGVEIDYTVAPLLEVFERMLAEKAYEACEFSLANYIMLKDRGADWLHAIPVFPYRAFRHSTLFVRKDSSLTSPSELSGKRAGLPDFSMTAAVWTRGILREQYGVHWQDLSWTVSGRQRFSVLEGVELTYTRDDLEDLLIAGHIDALLTPHTHDELKPAAERQLRPLIADPQAAEEEYLEKTGCYPINHVIVIREDTLTRAPSAPQALFEAYAVAKAVAYKRRLGTTLVPWGNRHWTAMFDRFGGNPLPYGLTPLNREVVARLAGFLADQRLISKLPEVDALFLPQSGSWSV
jgi:4,5-dihydroxyphthalate decarboxylase